MTKMMTAQQAAEQWELSLRRVQDYCKKGKIPGAERFGVNWMIPEGAPRPMDGRTKVAKELQKSPGKLTLPMPRKTPFLHMTDLYHTVGAADECIDILKENPEAQTLLKAWISYSRGQIDEVYEAAHTLLHKHSGFYAVISAGMLLAFCAIWRGDLYLWRQAKKHIAEAPARDDSDREIMAFSITAVDSMLYDITAFPEWFKMGRFELLHKDSLPAAKVFYAKYLYAAAYAVATKQQTMEGLNGLTLMNMLPFTIEPMISQAVSEQSVIAEIYLRMICAVIYHTGGDDNQAVYHIDHAIEKALPDRFYGLLAEYGRTVYPLLERRLSAKDPPAWEKVKMLYAVYNAGWSKLSGSVRGKVVALTLTQKEREVAKLAAFGMKNGEIAEKLHMSVSAVKQALNNVCNKTGMPREDFAAIL